MTKRDAIDDANDAWAKTPQARKLSRGVVRAQDALKRLVSKRAWAAYLAVEKAVNEREFDRGDAVAEILFRLARKIARDDLVTRLGRRALRQLETRDKRRAPRRP